MRNGGRRICDGRARVTVIKGAIAPAAKPTKSVSRAELRELPSTRKATECELLIVEMLVGDYDDSMMVGDHDDSIVVGAHDNSHRRPPVHAPSGFRWGSQCNQRGTKNCKSNQCAHVAPSRTISLILMREH